MRIRIVLVLLATMAIGCSSPKPTEIKEMPSQYAATFQLTTPERIIVEDFLKLSDSIPAKKTAIQDPTTIKKILALLFQLPDQGEVMIKMGDVPLKRLNLVFTDRIEVVEFYNGRIKTPATSFYAQPQPMEQLLFEFLSQDGEKVEH
jgi:hypothetical protein